VSEGNFSLKGGRIHLKSDVLLRAAIFAWQFLREVDEKTAALSPAQRAVHVGEMMLGLREALRSVARKETGIDLE
jgi:hypothetical protein